jgi:3',5'-cyclic-AMP phosphodiesterase
MINRRKFIQNSAFLGLMAKGFGIKAFTENINENKKRVLRFAHLTDIHIEPEMNAPEGLAKCLHHLQLQEEQPSFIMSGGDSVFDALAQPKDRVELQWKIWQNIFKRDNSLPVEYCIGNHDCWGYGQKEDPLYGKKYAMEKMNLSMPYRSFDKAGWHFIVLDSIQPKTDGSWYTCMLDEAQFNWLQNDLVTTPSATPVIIISHAPIVSAACVITDNKFKASEGYVISPGTMHADSPRIIELFDKHPNIKLCLSGHIHLYEQVVYNGITYICNGAVSGNWWKGIRYRTDNGYALINLYDDMTFDNHYVNYGWKV